MCADVNKPQRWLVCCAFAGSFFNFVIEEDPIMWLVKKTLEGSQMALISCFFLEVDDELFEKIKETINGH